MVCKELLEFLHCHEGLQVGFEEASHWEDCIIVAFSDPWKKVSYKAAVSLDKLYDEYYIDHLIGIAEEEMYGDKEAS